MKSRITTIATIAISIALFAAVGCSDDNAKAEPKGVFAEAVDSVAAAVADNVAETAVTRSPKTTEALMPTAAVNTDPAESIREVTDMVLKGDALYGVFDGGVLVHNFPNDSQFTIAVPERLQAIAVHNDTVYLGGDYLYTLEGDELRKLDYEFEGVINVLEPYGYALMIGTEAGLYTMGIFGREKLLDDMAVTALAAEQEALWVGTRGDGLYRWDGVDFRKRYLHRNETLFDTVYTLDYQHDHLYMGTSNGLHIFDGGRWNTLTIADGLPADAVISVDASGWVVYAIANEVVFSFYGGMIDQIGELDGYGATVVRQMGRRLLVGTAGEGVVMKTGRMVRTLVAPEVEGTDQDFTLNQ
jgi:hypothetical protein